MKFRNTVPSLWLVFFLAVLSIMFVSGCALWAEKQTEITTDKLQRIIKQYNLALETHSPTMGSVFVEPGHVEDYIRAVEEIRDKVTFNQSTLVNIVFLNDGEPVKQVYMQPEPGEVFNEAEVTIRYRLVVSPSTTMKTKILKQKWVASGNVWYLIPEVDSFFKEPENGLNSPKNP